MTKVDFDSIVSYFFDKRLYKPGEIGVTEALWCPRKPFFRIVFNSRIRPNRNMAMGALAHYAVQKYIRELYKDSKIEEEVEVRFDLGNGYYLKGDVDIIVDGIPYELKYPVSDKPNPQVEPFYMAQLNAYLNMLDVDYGYLIEFFFTDSGVQVHEVRVDREYHSFSLLIDRAKKITDAVKQGKIPQKSLFDWECRRCQYRVICKHLPEEVHIPEYGYSEVSLYDYDTGDDRE